MRYIVIGMFAAFNIWFAVLIHRSIERTASGMEHITVIEHPRCPQYDYSAVTTRHEWDI